MTGVPEPVCETTSLLEAARALAQSPQGVLPVVDADGAYLGILSARAVAEALADGEHGEEPVARIAELPPRLRSSDPLDLAIEALDASGGSAIPVVGPQGGTVVGRLTHQTALAALRQPARIAVPG